MGEKRMCVSLYDCRYLRAYIDGEEMLPCWLAAYENWRLGLGIPVGRWRLLKVFRLKARISMNHICNEQGRLWVGIGGG